MKITQTRVNATNWKELKKQLRKIQGKAVFKLERVNSITMEHFIECYTR